MTTPATPTVTVGATAAPVGAAVASSPVAKAGVVATVEAEIKAAAGAVEQAVHRRFTTTTEDAPVAGAPQAASGRKLNAKTIAEQAAGKKAISAYHTAE